MRGPRRLIAATAAAVLSLSLAAACGNGGDGGGGGGGGGGKSNGGRGSAATASPNGIEKDTSGVAVKKVAAALRGTASVHVTIRLTGARTADYRARGTDITGRLTTRAKTADYVVAGGRMSVRGDPGVLLSFGVARASALRAADRWVSAPSIVPDSGDQRVPLQDLHADVLAGAIAADDTPLRAGVGVQDLNGAPVAVLTQVDGSKIYAARTGTPFPLRATDSDGTVFDFADFGAPVTVTAPVGAADPATLPPAGTIAFISDQDGTDNLWAVRPDGGGRRQISHFVSGTLSRPALSPDGAMVAFQRSEDDKDDADIWLMNTDGTGARNLAPNVAKDGSPTWSPDGATITFVSNRDTGHYELYQMDANGGNVRQLTHGGPVNTEPAYSLEGGRSSFLECRVDFTDCFLLVGSAGATPRRVVSTPVDVVRPSWSPDGAKIAYTAPPNGHPKVFVANADGSGVRRLTSGTATDAQPAWSPDGSSIVFASNRDGTPSLYVARADGGGPRRITQSSGADGDTEPTWQR